MAYSSKTYSSRRAGNGYRRGGNAHFGGQRQSNNRRGLRKDYIDPSRFIKVAQPVEAEAYTPQYTFEEFQVHAILKQNLRAKNYNVPSPIQDKTIPHALEGRDVIGIADTGTGKTAAFAIPLLHQAMTNGAKALVVAPTRELAQQIEAELRSIARGSRLRGALLIGGTGMGAQFRDLSANPHIIIGTPGRIKDHLDRGSLNLSDFTIVVLDEVDRMLDMGFVNDVQIILGELHSEHQSLFFSATLDTRVNNLISSFSNDPITISIKSGDTSENVHQNVVYVNHQAEKIETLHDLLINGEIQKAIIFDDTQRSVERLSEELVKRGLKADAIHGGRSQGQRQRALNRFKKSEVDILVATDVAARGIDVSDITHVINYSTPQSYADYVHRIGRAGRAGRIGYALTFVNR